MAIKFNLKEKKISRTVQIKRWNGLALFTPFTPFFFFKISNG